LPGKNGMMLSSASGTVIHGDAALTTLQQRRPRSRPGADAGGIPLAFGVLTTNAGAGVNRAGTKSGNKGLMRPGAIEMSLMQNYRWFSAV
jgi:hypothetical protein